MDEDMSDDENRNRNNTSDNTQEKAKRLKTETNEEEASNHASTSSNSFPKVKNKRNRNYRRSHGDMSDSSEDEVEDSTLSLSPRSSSCSPNGLPETESDSEMEECSALKKDKPKHNWFVVPEILNRQMGCSSKLITNDLFQRRCYGALRNVQRLELMYKLEQHDGCVNSLNFHYDGSLLASGGDDLKIVLWDWKVGKCLLKYKTKHRGNVFQSKFLHLSGDLHIASSARDGQVRIAQISREEGIRNNRLLGIHKGPCHKLIVLPEQPHIILSAGEDGLVISHDVRSPKSQKIVSVKEDGREVALYSIHGHPLKGHEFCVSGRDQIVRVYDQRKSNTPVGTYSPFAKNHHNNFLSFHVTSAVYNHDGSEILASYSDADIYLFDVNAPMGNYIHKYQGHRNGATIKGVNFFGPKSEFVISGSDCGNIYFWERNTESIVQWMLADDNGVVNCLEPHPQLPFLCTSGLDWDVKVWVPSCEDEPAMQDLPETVKNNYKLRVNLADNAMGNENQMLWMLWRHLRGTTRLRRAMTLNTDNFMFHINATSTSSSSSNSENPSNEDEDDGEDEDDDDDDLVDGPQTCNTS